MKPEQVKYIVVHCSATPADMDIGVVEIDRWHKQNGWAGIGYHYVIRRDGTLEVGRLLDKPGAHAAGFNSQSIGICLVGGIDDEGQPQDNFTAIQKAVLRSRLNWLKAGDYKHAAVIGHRDLPDVNKACPSFDVRTWY